MAGAAEATAATSAASPSSRAVCSSASKGSTTRRSRPPASASSRRIARRRWPSAAPLAARRAWAASREGGPGRSAVSHRRWRGTPPAAPPAVPKSAGQSGVTAGPCAGHSTSARTGCQPLAAMASWPSGETRKSTKAWAAASVVAAAHHGRRAVHGDGTRLRPDQLDGRAIRDGVVHDLVERDADLVEALGDAGHDVHRGGHLDRAVVLEPLVEVEAQVDPGRRSSPGRRRPSRRSPGPAGPRRRRMPGRRGPTTSRRRRSTPCPATMTRLSSRVPTDVSVRYSAGTPSKASPSSGASRPSAS